MTRKVVSPIALDKSINTTEQTPRNIADVLAQQLAAIKTAIESGNGNLEAAFVCYYGVTTATQIKEAIEDGKVPYFYYNGAVAQLWKVETDKYTFRTTNTRSVEGQTILDVVDYVVNGSVWSTITREVSGGSSSGQSYITSVNSLADFDTTGKSGMQDLISVANVPADGVYQVSVMLHITPKTASATKSDLVLQFTSSDNTGWPSHTFHAVVDDSQTFAQQLSFSTSVSLKAGQNTLRIQCGGLNTEYLVFVDELTLAQLVNGSYKGIGIPIYASLQDAIADYAMLPVDTIFDTNGFHSNGDGGAARYIVSSTGTPNGMDVISLGDGKKAILQPSEESIPEQYGAYGDNSTDDTDVFDYLFTNNDVKVVKLSENKTYKIQFKNWTFSNKSVIGTNKDTSRLSQMSLNLNTPLFTLGTNCDIGNFTIVCGGGNTVRTGVFHFGADSNGTFRPYIGTRLHDIHAYCVSNTIPVDISYTESGSYNLKVEHCKFDNPGVGIRISNLGDTTHQSYISDFYFEDILVSGPYDYGFEIDKAQSGGMMVSHGIINQFSVQLQRDGSCGFKLTYGDITLVNPTAFIENTSGVVYSVELDFLKSYPSNLVNGIANCYGGILEGIIKNKEYLDKVGWNNTDFVEEEKFSDNLAGIRPSSRHLSTTPVSIYHNTCEEVYKSISLTNGTKQLVDDENGQSIQVSVSDFGQSEVTVDIPIELPNENIFTTLLLFGFTNGFLIRTNHSEFPKAQLIDANSNTIDDMFGVSLVGEYGRLTMDSYKKYYGYTTSFDITNADRNVAWKLRLSIPTIFSSSVENAKVNLYGFNIFNNCVTIADINLRKARNIEWYQKNPVNVISQSKSASTTGQTLSFIFTQVTFRKLAFMAFSVKNIVLTADDTITVDIMSGSTIVKTFTMDLKAGTHSFEFSYATGGTSYTPKIVLTSSNSSFSSASYSCYVQGIAN